MHRLSVVVPAILGHNRFTDSNDQTSFEETLVALLTNRPASCEIVVVCPASYQDEYGLGDEVQFVQVDDDSVRWTTLANIGIHAAEGAYINVVMPGIDVLENWDAAAIDRLQRTSRMGSVSPLILDNRTESSNAAITGLDYRAIEPLRVRNVQRDGRALGLPIRIDGPTAGCGFFRRQDLLELGGWDERLPDHLAAVDLALRLRRRGLASVCDPDSCVALRSDVFESASSPVNLRIAEQLFWSHAGQVGAKAWLGYAVSWLNPKTVPPRLAGVFRAHETWTADDFHDATHARAATPLRRAA